MMAARNAARLGGADLHVDPDPMDPQIVALEPTKQFGNGRKIDQLFAVILIVAVSVFAGAFAMLTLNPAIKTLATAALRWTSEGP